MIAKILFLDDCWKVENWKNTLDDLLPESVTVIYEEYGYKALQRLKEHPEIKLVFLDLNFEGQKEQGKEILNKIKDEYPDLRVVILTSINDAQLALKLVHDEKKAYYFFTKGSLDLDQVKKFIENTIEVYDIKAQAIKTTDKGLIIGESPALTKILQLVAKASQKNSTVLITGESGTGKELIARAIHFNSLRKTGPFIAINCGAITKTLVESELFGHVKGAFSGATTDKKGKFEIANKGTIFLDEIGELDLELQVKLLRVIQEGEIEKVGNPKPQKIDVRIIAATNRNLEEQVEKGLFRADLFHRLNVIPAHMPPLRERKEDIPALAEYLVQKLNIKLEESKQLSAEAIELLKKYDWPGNIRELENKLELAIVRSLTDVIQPTDFELKTSTSSASPKPVISMSANVSVDAWIKNLIEGKACWEDVRQEFGASGDSRKRILEGVVAHLKEKLSKRPTGNDISDLLKIKRNHVNQILSELGLKLKDF